LLWAFKQVTQKKMYYVIPAGKTYAAVLNFESGTVTLSAKEDAAHRALGFLAEHAPWAVLGHSPEIAAIYKDKKRREELRAHVREGIEQAQAAAAAAAGSVSTAGAPAAPAA
jgi:hypothetical protein